jgi:flavin-dependent dehydrogenase
MVDPIIGGGMSIATASAHMLGGLMARAGRRQMPHELLASEYRKAWNSRFAARANLAASLGKIERSKVLSESLLFLMGCAPVIFPRLLRGARRDPLFSLS